jgi:hypothetical protein
MVDSEADLSSTTASIKMVEMRDSIILITFRNHLLQEPLSGKKIAEREANGCRLNDQ